jgi:hypothetical protein
MNADGDADHEVTKKHLQRRLNDFGDRFNRRFWVGRGFNGSLPARTNANTTIWAELRR